ncbi:MAG: PaaR repeat-containing protein [Rickettsiales bacterium]|nr:PaaR repeat-containing protein [Rickettsiales bacterium]|tara:strand:+ start:5680 stop:5967 length:288 start_codon:yes stop_codon:yes gene_type:complete
MPAVHRKGDICTGHGCFPPRPNAQGSPNVFCNSIPVHRQGDSWNVHCCGIPCHGGSLAAGSSSVNSNSKQLGRISDPVSCGSAAANGSGNVFAGG